MKNRDTTGKDSHTLCLSMISVTLLVLLCGCSQDLNTPFSRGTGAVSLSVSTGLSADGLTGLRVNPSSDGTSSASARTVLPAVSPDSYEITFSGPEAVDPVVSTDGSETIELLPGTWEISVAAFAGASQVATGLAADVVVEDGERVLVPIEVSPNTAGTGGFSITVSWSGIDTIDGVDAVLDDGSAETLEPAGGSVTFESSGVSSGSHTVVLKMKDGSVLMAVIAEAVQVYDTLTSSASFPLDAGVFTAAPAAPSGLTAQEGVGLIELSWMDDAVLETEFVVERSESEDTGYAEIATLGANTTSCDDLEGDDTPITEGTTYYYRVKATNDFGESGYSDPANAALESPYVESCSPVDGSEAYTTSEIVITFSEAMNTSATEGAFDLTDGSGSVSGTFDWNVEDTMLTFTPDAALTAGTCDVTVGTGAEDLVGNGIEAEYSSSFTAIELFSREVNVTNSSTVPGTHKMIWTGDQFSIAYQGDNTKLWYIGFTLSGTRASVSDHFEADGSYQYSFNRAPGIAYGGTTWGLSWGEYGGGDMHLGILDSDESHITTDSPFSINTTSDVKQHSSVAWNPVDGEYGVVWTDDKTGDMDLYFARIDATGTENAEFQITAVSGHDEHDPVVLWKEDGFAVIYIDDNDNGDIHMIHIDPDETDLTFELGSDIALTTDGYDSYYPDAVWTGTFIAVVRANRSEGSNRDIFFSLYNQEGTAAQDSSFQDIDFIVNDPSGDIGHYSPSICWTGYEFGIAWIKGSTGDIPQFCRITETSGDWSAGTIVPSIGGGCKYQRLCSVVWADGVYAISYGRTDTYSDLFVSY